MLPAHQQPGPRQVEAQRRRRILEALRAAGALTADQVQIVLTHYPRLDAPTDEMLEALRLLRSSEVTRTLSEYYHVPAANLDEIEPDPALAMQLPERIVMEFQALPIASAGAQLQVAMADPSDVMAEDTVRKAISRPVLFSVAAESKLQAAIHAVYGSSVDLASEMDLSSSPILDRLGEAETSVFSARELEAQAQQLPTIRIVNQVIGVGVSHGASDIHIEPQENVVQVRMRVDGVLEHYVNLPKAVQAAITSRIKLMGNMDISDTRRPQDGRCRVSVNRKTIDLRISSLPTGFGEKVAIRILDQSGPALTLENLDFSPEILKRLEHILSLPQGMLLVTGPTGSGKSTSLYACITELKRRSRNIITVEDPVERQIPGVSQVGVNVKAGVTFASALRNILRQDPNVIMIGEIRDEETAEIAVQASLTGHIVLSTLHTNDAASTITRLKDMGIAAHLLSPALSGVLAQRLVRKICDVCHGESRWSGSERGGCTACHSTGYRGRMALFELLENTPAIAALISRGATAEEIREAARAAGMKGLDEDAAEKINAGLTTREEAAIAVDLSRLRDDAFIAHPSSSGLSQRSVDSNGLSSPAAPSNLSTASQGNPGGDASDFPAQEGGTRPGGTSWNLPAPGQSPEQAGAGDPSAGTAPQDYPQQGPPQQSYPPQGQPSPGYSPPGNVPGYSPGYAPPGAFPQGVYTPAGYPPQGYPPQGYPPQGYPQPGYPPQGYPQPGYPPQGYLQPGYPPQGYLQPGYPSPGYPPPAPDRAIPRILVVDDDPSIRMLVTDLLRRNFFEVVEAENGRLGMEMALAELPDLVLSDVMMPDMDGYEMCKHIRANPRTGGIPVLIMTSQDTVDDEVRGLEVGADDYIPKPLERRRLLARVHALLRRRQR